MTKENSTLEFLVMGLNLQMHEVNRELTAIRGEVDGLRTLAEASLTLQQAALNQDKLQGDLEEFIYQFEKTLSYTVGNKNLSEYSQYEVLSGVLKKIKSSKITTAIIRGVQNKQMYDRCLDLASRHLESLATTVEVKYALEQKKASEFQNQTLTLKKNLEDAEQNLQLMHEKASDRSLKQWMATSGGCMQSVIGFCILVIVSSLGSMLTKGLYDPDEFKAALVFFLFFGSLLVILYGTARNSKQPFGDPRPRLAAEDAVVQARKELDAHLKREKN
jgi:hypothetical protein